MSEREQALDYEHLRRIEAAAWDLIASALSQENDNGYIDVDPGAFYALRVALGRSA